MTSSPEQIVAWERADGAARATAAFARAFDGAPDGVWSAPGRVNVIGEHTDYNGGTCLPMALPHRTYVAFRHRADDTIRLVSAQEGTPVELSLGDVAPGTVEGWAGYVAGVAWALAQAGHAVSGFDAAVDSCVPYGAGLSSSAALECAVAVALDDTHGLGFAASDEGRGVLAQACIRAENEIAGAPTGGMDQSASLRCQAGHALFLDTRDGATRHIPLELGAHGLALLVMDTRAEHQLVDGQYAARRAMCEAAARTLGVATLREVTDLEAALAQLADVPDAEVVARRVRHVVSEIARVQEVADLLEKDAVEDLGAVLSAAHASLRDDYEVSCAELDVAVDVAVATGALGGRMVGGGFGGSAIALVRLEDVDQVASAVAQAFAERGWHAPAFLVAQAADPAGRD